jgi:hypothetical protein
MQNRVIITSVVNVSTPASSEQFYIDVPPGYRAVSGGFQVPDTVRVNGCYPQADETYSVRNRWYWELSTDETSGPIQAVLRLICEAVDDSVYERDVVMNYLNPEV